LMFNKFDRALLYTRALVRKGYHLTAQLLQSLVGTIISRGRLREARILFYLIIGEWNSAEASDASQQRLDLSAASRLLIHQLASFCGIKLCETNTWKIVNVSSDLKEAIDEKGMQTAKRRIAQGHGSEYTKDGLIWMETTALREGLLHMAQGLALDSIRYDILSVEKTMSGVIKLLEVYKQGARKPLIERLEKVCSFLSARSREDENERRLRVLMHRDAKRLRVRGYREAIKRKEKAEKRLLSGDQAELSPMNGHQSWTERQVEFIPGEMRTEQPVLGSEEWGAKDSTFIEPHGIQPDSMPSIRKEQEPPEEIPRDTAPLGFDKLVSHLIPLTAEEDEFSEELPPQQKTANASAG